jgi:PhzF family phenazine biosynthesis protein
MNMKAELYQVDSFTAEPFKGNPAGVCLLDQPAPQSWMQSLAMEMNLAETAFIYPESDGFRLRWFTPVTEVELCGHATLATAHILFENGKLKPNDTARFLTKSGILTVRKINKLLEMNFPATPASQCPEPENLSRALGNVNFLFSGKNDFDYLIELDSEDVIRSLKPDFDLLKKVTARGIIVTSRSRNSQFDFVSRFFAPTLGIDEDPVTGSAHCTLGPYWAKKLGKSKFTAYQASRRGGIVQVELKGDRVLLRGQAVTIFSASLTDKVRNE